MSERFPILRSFCTLLLLVSAAAPLDAQTSKQAGKVSFSITRFDPMDRPAPALVVRNGSKETPVEVPLTYIAGPFTATLGENQQLDFFEPGGVVPVVSTVIPAELQKDLLIVFVPRKESYEILRIHTPPSTIKGGDHYVINATNKDVAIKFGSIRPVLIQSKKTALLHDPAAGDALTLPVTIQQKDGEKWKPVATENWPHDPRFRTFLFLYTSLRDQHIAFHGITQRMD